MKGSYVGIVAMAERLHRRAMELLDAELARNGIGDLSATQAMILLQMGREQMTVSELTLRGCYQGTNVSYNLKRLTESGYVEQARSGWDRRVINVQASAKGLALLEHLEGFYAGLDLDLTGSGFDAAYMAECEGRLSRLERASSGRLSQQDRSYRGPASNVVAIDTRKQVA
jgi:DNA-binding MarR family transcriptional regulator